MMGATRTGRHGVKRHDSDQLERVQAGNRAWWEATPMTYGWRDGSPVPLSLEWFDEQDQRSIAAHHHFADNTDPLDRLIPYESLRGKEVLEIGIGAGLYSELLARAGAHVTGIDLTDA